MKILLASNNKHKAEEIKHILDEILPNQIELVLPKQITDTPIDPEETGINLGENAEIKAKAFFDEYKIICIADDTGLEIEALDMAPGVNSARFSGVHGNDKANRSKVLDLLKNKNNRNARFRCVFCFYDGKAKHFSEGICNGKIIDDERGEMGFGYDSIFVPDGFNQTFAEMNSSEKNAISHRFKATLNLADFLKDYIINSTQTAS